MGCQRRRRPVPHGPSLRVGAPWGEVGATERPLTVFVWCVATEYPPLKQSVEVSQMVRQQYPPFFAPSPWPYASADGHSRPRRLPRPQRAAAARRSASKPGGARCSAAVAGARRLSENERVQPIDRQFAIESMRTECTSRRNRAHLGATRSVHLRSSPCTRPFWAHRRPSRRLRP